MLLVYIQQLALDSFGEVWFSPRWFLDSCIVLVFNTNFAHIHQDSVSVFYSF